MKTTREILFRGKRVDNGEWVEGSFIPDLLEVFHGAKDLDGFIKPFGKTKEERMMVEVERKTVGQYTGLKDDNGTKVFEGDICKNKKGQIFLVVWSSPLLEFIWSIKRGDDSHLWDSGSLCTVCHFEVIGNVHDNPELLNKESE